MSNLTTTNTKGINLPAPIPPEMVPVNSALEVLQTALTAGIEAYAKAEYAKTQRDLILVKKGLAALSLDAATKKTMQKEDQLHDRRMKIIQIVENHLIEHVESLTPEILSATQSLIDCLREMH